MGTIEGLNDEILTLIEQLAAQEGVSIQEVVKRAVYQLKYGSKAP